MKADYNHPGDICEIDGRNFIRQANEVRYHYAEEASRCPICKGVGWVWAGWFSCDNANPCGALALVDTGETFLPVSRRQP